MRDIKLLWKWGKRYIVTIFVVVFLAIFLQYLYSYIPLFVQYAIKVLEDGTSKVNLPKFIIDFFNFGKTPLEIILYVAIGIVLLQFVRLVLRFIHNYMKGALTEAISRDMRVALYDHIQTLSYTYHNKADTGDLIQRCTSDIDTSSGFISNKIQDFINLIATIIIGAYQVGSINLTLMWVSMALIPITAISSVIYFRYVNRAFDEIEKSESDMMTIIQENLASSRVVRAFANEKFEIDKLDKQNLDYSKKNYRFNKKMALYWGISDALVMLQYVATLTVGVFLAKEGHVDPSEITACLMLMGMLIWPIRSLGRLISDYGKTMVALRRIEEVLEEPSEYLINGDLKPEIKGNIEFKNVSFKFDDDDKHFLNGVSFDIKAGETVAIIGKTGSGKSTIVNLLTRMLEYQDGEILYDGIPLKDIEKRYLRKNIGIVLQNPFLFSKTVYDNITIADKKAGEERVYDAANVASIHEDILKFEKGYHTLVGEKGTTLSGGQKQRVAIARILVDEKPIIIFDDSLSAVDTETDMMIRQALKKKTKRITTIIITHRITTAKEADKIIVLEDGRVSAIGNHEELSKKPGLYQNLWSIQGSLEKEFEQIFKGGDE